MHGGVNAALANNGCVYPTDVATLFNQFNAAGVSWKSYAQDLGGAQPVGATSYVTGSTPGVTDTVPGREDGLCGYPGPSNGDPVTNPTNLVAPSGDVSSYTGAQPANANNNGDPADQYVAKHFPAPWFNALTGESMGAQSGVNYPAQPALNEADVTSRVTTAGRRRRGRATPNCDPSHIANLDDPTYGLGPRPEPPAANEVPGFSWITPNNCSATPTCQLPGQQPLGGLQRQRDAESCPIGPAGLRP